MSAKQSISPAVAAALRVILRREIRAAKADLREATHIVDTYESRLSASKRPEIYDEDLVRYRKDLAKSRRNLSFWTRAVAGLKGPK